MKEKQLRKLAYSITGAGREAILERLEKAAVTGEGNAPRVSEALRILGPVREPPEPLQLAVGYPQTEAQSEREHDAATS